MKKIILAIMVMILLGGCSMSGIEGTKKQYTVKELTEGGVINVEKARESGYVPYAETANDIVISSNDKAKAYVEEHYDDIVENAKAVIKKMIGREVEITFIATPFPYMAASIHYKTVDFPIIYGSTGVGFEESLQFLEGGYKEIDKSTTKKSTVASLYAFAFEEEINTMINYFKKQFPEYRPVELGTVHSDIFGKSSPFISIEVVSPDGEMAIKEYEKNVIDTIYFAYSEDNKMGKEKLRELFQGQEEFYIVVRYNGYLIDETVIPTKEMYKKIMEEIRNYNYSWCNNKLKGNPVTIGSNLRKKGDVSSMIEFSEIV